MVVGIPALDGQLWHQKELQLPDSFFSTFLTGCQVILGKQDRPLQAQEIAPKWPPENSSPTATVFPNHPLPSAN